MVFISPNSEDVWALAEILNKFGDATRLRTNKSLVVPIRWGNLNQPAILDRLLATTKTFPVRYLGLSLYVRRLKRVNCQPLFDKDTSTLDGWKRQLLTPSGRLTLVNSVLSSRLIFLLTTMHA